ncbi:MAG: hypothetical protein KDE24_29555, partial [Caldilinea sp.]|nr:hypothetical protein [Caldilinea sp.]
MTPNAVETNHHKRNGKVNGKAAALDAAAIAEIVAQLRAIEPTAVEVEAPVDAEPASQAAPAPAPTTTEAEPAPSATGETTEEQPPKAPIPHNPQREAHYVFLGKSDNMLYGLETVGEPMASLLVANRITPQRLAGVRTLVEAGYASIATRGDAMGAEATTVIALQRALGLARISYANLRQVGRTVFPDPVADYDARLNLALDQPIPGTIMLFIDKGLGILAKAKQEPQATRLAAAAFDEERIDEMIALFNALDLLYAARRQARQAAK